MAVIACLAARRGPGVILHVMGMGQAGCHVRGTWNWGVPRREHRGEPDQMVHHRAGRDVWRLEAERVGIGCCVLARRGRDLVDGGKRDVPHSGALHAVSRWVWTSDGGEVIDISRVNDWYCPREIS